MAQYWIDQLHCLATPGEWCEPAVQYGGGVSGSEHGFVPNKTNLLFTNNSGSRVWSSVIFPSLGKFSDTDIMIKFRQIGTPIDSFTNFGIGILCRFDPISKNFISFPTPSKAVTSYVVANGVVNGTFYSVVSYTGPAKSYGTWLWWRVKLSGNKCNTATSLVELPPISSDKNITFSGYPDEGYVGIITASYIDYGTIYEIESFAVGTDGDIPPTSSIGCANVATLSGIVYDHRGYPCARKVQVFLRLTGALVGYTESDSMTGVWSITTQFVGMEHTVVVQDGVSEPNMCDLIASSIIP